MERESLYWALSSKCIQVMALCEGGDSAKPECKANADELGRVGAVPHALIPHHAESFGVKLFWALPQKMWVR